MANTTTCFGKPDCAEIQKRLAKYLGKSKSTICCNTKMVDLGFTAGALGGLAPMINSIRKKKNNKPLPMTEIRKASTVEKLCALIDK